MRYSFLTGENAEQVANWAAARIPGCETGWQNCVALVVHDEEEIRGVVVFHDYDPHSQSIGLSAAGKTGWITRQTVRLTHEYIFENCQIAVWQVLESNAESNELARRLGYTPHKIPRLGGRDEARIIWTMTDDEWRESPFRKR